ncbi:MAG TPA: Bor family protein [Pelobium sp.]
MKTIKLSVLGLSLILFSSCYTSKVAVGDIKIDEPTVKVNSVKNHNLIYGLIPLTKGYEAKTYVGNKSNYIIKTQHSFVDGLLNVITFSIYNPTTTTFYVPLGEVKN